MRNVLILSFLGSLGACSNDSDSDVQSWKAADLYSSKTQQLIVEVDYQTGADPFIDGMAFSGKSWDLFELNMKALFDTAPTDLKIPKKLSEMTEMKDVKDKSFSLERIVEISDAHLDTKPSASQKVIHVLFLNGSSQDDKGNDEQVLGLSVVGTNIIALFKPVITSFTQLYPELAEQTTLIHEVGHAVGLVNAGVSMVKDHLDTGKDTGKAHCENKSCVMYWEFESGNGVDERLGAILDRDDQILFDANCLADTKAAVSN